MMILLSLINLMISTSFVSARCSFALDTFRCEGADEMYPRAFYDNLPEKLPPELHIEILDSQWTVIKYFHHLAVEGTHYELKSITIRNSSVQEILDRAFKDLEGLETLDLSSNRLVNISFVRYLPDHLKYLRLNENSISIVEDVFDHFDELDQLEMSGNQISVLDLRPLTRIKRINFSRNFIAIIKPSNKYQFKESVDLSYNNISIFDDGHLELDVLDLDMSHNHLESLELTRVNTITLLNIEMTSVHLVICNPFVHELILSYNEFKTTSELNISVLGKLVMKNSNIPELSNDNIVLREKIIRSPGASVDLSNSSITDIKKHYFQDVDIRVLNLSYNNIKTLRNDIFLSSSVNHIDFSHSRIGNLEPGIFTAVASNHIDLSFNEISSLQHIFRRVDSSIINLSSNKIKVIETYSFVECSSLNEIILSECGIEKIEMHSFVNLDTLKTLDLSNNKLLILEENTFHDIPIETLKLQGNRIKTVRTHAFNNLPNLQNLILSGVRMDNLETNAFFNLPRVKKVDLSRNEISVIPPNLFKLLENLTEIDLGGNHIRVLNKFSNELGLKELTLSFNGSILANTISNSHIEYLSIQESTIDVLENDSLKGLYNLRELRFSESKILFVDQGALKDLFNLKFLDSQNLFKYTRHMKKFTFADLRSLRSLDLSYLNLETIESYSFEGLRKLSFLTMRHNKLIDICDGVFTGLNALEKLDLSFNQIMKVDDGALKALASLMNLNMGYNKLTKLSFSILAGLNSLEILNLQDNDISSIAADSFKHLSSLRELQLQNNQITRITIGTFHHLTNLNILNLSNNFFESYENGVFSNLKNITILDLSGTSLIKLEEVSIFLSMMNLQKLYLDRNHLKQFDMKRLLSTLRKITHVGISHNKWRCTTLSQVIEMMIRMDVGYKSSEPVYDSRNIDGIKCFDICEFVYCSPEKGEPNRDQ